MGTGDRIIPCDHCGTKNRIPSDRTVEKAFCGKCHKLIVINGSQFYPTSANDVSFNNIVINHQGTVLVDFWASWCRPCRMMSPILDELSKKYAGKLKVVKVNIDENPLSASRYDIRSIPSLLIFKDGKLMKSITGAQQRDVLERVLTGIM